jgi:hypothetical protein
VTVERALDAFMRNGLLILIDDRPVEQLDDVVMLGEQIEPRLPRVVGAYLADNQPTPSLSGPRREPVSLEQMAPLKITDPTITWQLRW